MRTPTGVSMSLSDDDEHVHRTPMSRGRTALTVVTFVMTFVFAYAAFLYKGMARSDTALAFIFLACWCFFASACTWLGRRGRVAGVDE